MSEENRCPQCGAALPEHAPQGLCPGCLLQRGLETPTAASLGGNEPVAAAAQPPTPAELAGYFPDLEILELVGRGGMGVVYKARQKQLDRLVALKILSPKIGQDPAFAARFAREARAMAMLNHPHIVTVYDSGQASSPIPTNLRSVPVGEESGVRPTSFPLPFAGEGSGVRGTVGETPLYYFLMEFVDGVSLRRLLDTSRLAPREALAIVPQICDALQYAHDMGVVHRDIKPENILLDKQGRVKIADFGIAKLVGGDPQDRTLTGAGQVMGTPHYMAPEQTEHPQEVDHRADIYSLGVVFYQMLTGELPLGRFAPPSQKVQIDVRLDEVVLRALEKEPARRYQQANEVKTEVATIATTPNSAAAGGQAGAATTADLAIASLRWAARAFALLVFLFFALFFIGEGPTGAAAMPFGKAQAAERIEWAGMSLMVLGLMIGWQWEGLAALCILVGAMEFHVVEWRCFMGFLDLPLFVGGLYALCWLLERRYPRAGNRALRDVLGGPMVRARNGQRWIYRPAVVKMALVILGVSLAAQLPVANILGGKYHPGVFVSLVLAGLALLAAGIYRGLTAPLERLAPLDEPPPRRPTDAGDEGIADHYRLAHSQREVQGPAVGLIVASLVNWLAIFLVLPGFVLPMRPEFAPRMPMGIFLSVVAILALSSALILIGALRMQRLESLAWARTAGVLAMLIGPGYIVGWPVGIWALVVLGRREVRSAFGREGRTAPAHATRKETYLGLTGLALCLAGVPIALVSGQLAFQRHAWMEMSAEMGGILMATELFALGLAIAGRKSGIGKAAIVAALALLLTGLVFLYHGTVILGQAPHHGQAPQAALQKIKGFDVTAKPIAKDGTAVDQGAWRIEAKADRDVRLFEVPEPGVDDCTLHYRAMLKTENLAGRAYLEMWCRMPAGGEYFSKGLTNPVSGTADWAACEAPFFLRKGERPDLVKLNVVVEGRGTLWIKNVELLKGPLPAAQTEAAEGPSQPVAGGDAAELSRQGWELWRNGRMNEALAKFHAAVKLTPDDANAWNGLGWASFNSGKLSEAEKAFKKVVALSPDHPAGLNGLGQLYLLQRKYELAEKYLVQAAPQAPAAWWGLTRLYLLQGKFDQAEKWAQKVVDSGQADDGARKLLQAAKEKRLSDSLRRTIEPPPAKMEQLPPGPVAPAHDGPKKRRSSNLGGTS